MKLALLMLLAGCATEGAVHEGVTTTRICILAVCNDVSIETDVEIKRQKRDASVKPLPDR